MKLTAPGTASSYSLANGNSYTPGPDGAVDAPATDVPGLVAIGFSFVSDVPVDTTTGRPVIGLLAGMMYFDSTLGKPIWRNAANSGWVDATGTSV